MNAATKKIKLEDKCRDFLWVKKKFEEDKLFLSTDRFNKGCFEKFRIIIKCVQEIYENKWDLDIEVMSSGNVKVKGIIILFNRIDLKNSEGAEHLIENLFVKIHLRKDGTDVKLYHLSGGRTKISYAEWCSNYFHSHLPTGYGARGEGSPYFSSFCTGSGHINEFMADLNSEPISQSRLVPFLLQIIGLVSWESLEGGPHRRIRNIRVNSNSGRLSRPNDRDSKFLMDKILEYHRSNEIIPDIEFKLEDNKYKILDNDRFVKFLEESTTLTEEEKARVLCMQNSEGQYYKYGNVPGYTPAPDTSQDVKFIFQGEEIPFIIGPPPEVGDLSNIHYFIHPNIKKFIKKEIEYDINIKKIRKSTIDRYSGQTDNARESTESNKVPLQENT